MAKDNRALVWDNFLTTRTNIFYYQDMVNWWLWVETIIKIVTGLVSSATFMALAAKCDPKIPLWLSAAAALAQVASGALRVSERIRSLSSMLSEYIALYAVFKQLVAEGDEGKDIYAQTAKAMARMTALEIQEVKDHPKPNRAALDAAQRAAWRAEGVEAPANT